MKLGGEAAFIVSTGRCGSSSLLRALSMHQSVLAISEFFAAVSPERVLAEGLVEGKALLRLFDAFAPGTAALLATGAVSEILLKGDRPPRSSLHLVTLPALTNDADATYEAIVAALTPARAASSAALVTFFFDWLCARFRRERWLERSGASLEYAGKLLEWWPAARFVHLHRSGPECAYSMSRHPYFRVAVARAVARNPTLEVETCLAHDLPLDRFGAYWSACTIRGLRALGRRPGTAVLHVSFGALISSPRLELQRVAEFLGLAVDGAWLDLAATKLSQDGPRAPPLPDAERRTLERVCAPGHRAISAATRVASRSPVNPEG